MASARPSLASVEKPMTDEEALRDAIIEVLIENDGENLRSLLKALSKDNSLDAERLVEVLIQHPALRDLVPDYYMGSRARFGSKVGAMID
jgi:hypothetical protein